MMKWDDCLDYKVKKQTPNPNQAQSLLLLTNRRLTSIHHHQDDFPQFLIESYYETIKELISALLALYGYKSYSHECLIIFLGEYYSTIFNESQLKFIDSLRKLRSDIQYRGKDIADDYLKRNQEKIETIIQTLITLVKQDLPH